MPPCWTVCPPPWQAVIVLVPEIEWNGCPHLNLSILITVHSISLGHWWWQVCSKKPLCELRQRPAFFSAARPLTQAEGCRGHLGIYQWDFHLHRGAQTLKKHGLPGPFWAFFLHHFGEQTWILRGAVACEIQVQVSRSHLQLPVQSAEGRLGMCFKYELDFETMIEFFIAFPRVQHCRCKKEIASRYSQHPQTIYTSTGSWGWHEQRPPPWLGADEGCVALQQSPFLMLWIQQLQSNQRWILSALSLTEIIKTETLICITENK